MRSFLTCLESIAFSLIFHWAYSATEFKNRADRYLQDQSAPRMGTWRAIRDAIDLSDIANAVWMALGYGWHGLVRWWKGSSADKVASTGPVGHMIGMVVSAAKKRRDLVKDDRDKQGPSPFDDSTAAVAPTAPDLARDSTPGRTRTFNGHDGYGRPMVYDGQRTDYEPLRGNISGDSSSSDRSAFRH
jgi:hypothetical protein